MLTRITRGSEAYSRANALIFRAVAWAVIPMAALFSLVAGPIVRLLYGAKWDAAIPLLPWALAGAVMAAFYQTTTVLILADAQQRRCVFAEAMSLVGSTACLVLLLPHGASAYLAGLAAIQAVVVVWMLSALTAGGTLRRSVVIRAVCTPLAICIPLVLVFRRTLIQGSAVTVQMINMALVAGGFNPLFGGFATVFSSRSISSYRLLSWTGPVASSVLAVNSRVSFDGGCALLVGGNTQVGAQAFAYG